MKKLGLVITLILVASLFGCKTTTTQEATTTATTTKELTIDDIFSGVKDNYHNATGVKVEEYSILSFKSSGQLFEYEIKGIYESTKNPLVHKMNAVMDYDGVGRFEMDSYFTKVEDKYYQYATALNGSSLTKTQITEAEFNENIENDMLELVVDVKPTNVTNTRKYTTDGVNYIEYTNVFKLSQLNTKYRSILQFDIEQFYGEYSYSLISDIDIEEKIIINLDQLVIISATFNVTGVMQKCMDDYLGGPNAAITNLTSEHKFTFSKYNEVTIDTTKLQ